MIFPFLQENKTNKNKQLLVFVSVHIDMVVDEVVDEVVDVDVAVDVDVVDGTIETVEIVDTLQVKEDATVPTLTLQQQPDFDPRRAQHQGHVTDSSYNQSQVEERVYLIRESNNSSISPEKPFILLRDKHISWLIRNLHSIPGSYKAFDALQSWLSLWIIHSLNLLGVTLPSEDVEAVINYLSQFQDTIRGGYGGGPRQAAHLAATFSVVMALCSLGTDAALRSIDVAAISTFLYSVKQPDGSFRVSQHGEADARALYCALSLASILKIVPPHAVTEHPLYRNVGPYLASLQAFDGGLAGEPGAEAHGGNSYCAFAAAVLAGQTDALDCEALLDWAVMRQMPYEGGFQGRTNKLVDSCYSFWVGSLFTMLANTHHVTTCGASMDRVQQQRQRQVAHMFDAEALQRYILECCQVGNGGLRDKPGVGRDLMHSCYALSGLSVAQHYGNATVSPASNRVERINVVYNLREDKLQRAMQFFDNLASE